MTAELKNTLPFLLVFLFACGNSEEFEAIKSRNQGNFNRETHVGKQCSRYTLIRPEVDFLFVWDNSTSTRRLSDQAQSALRQVASRISQEYNYRIMLAPLLLPSNSDVNFGTKLVAFDQEGLSQSDKSILISRDNIANALEEIRTTNTGSSRETGLQRVQVLLENARNKRIFRRSAHLIVVLFSNEDDNGHNFDPLHTAKSTKYKFAEDTVIDFDSYANERGLTQLRFISLVNHSRCAQGTETEGVIYKKVSAGVYGNINPDYQLPSIGNTPDSFDLCNSSFSDIFSQIDKTIDLQLIAHKYDYWPLDVPQGFIIGEDSIRVYKDGVRVTRSSSNGFSYSPRVYENQNTRYFPTPGEPYSGYMIQLHGTERVIYPQCLRIEVKTPEAKIGYIHLQHYPSEETIEVFINGQALDKSNWELIKDEDGRARRFVDKNINILFQDGVPKMCGNDYCPDETNPYPRTGYFLRLEPQSVFQNADFFSVDYHPGNPQ